MGIVILEKNKLDLDFDDVVITVTDSVAVDAGQDFVAFLRNRKNDSGWGTTGSSDAGNTTIVAMTGDLQFLTDLMLIGHNFKAYTAQYWNGSAWLDFSPAINVTANASDVTTHNFDEVMAYGVRIVIAGTQIPNEDKLLCQLIMTNRIGQYVSQPMVKKPTISRGKKARKMLSGRSSVTRTIGAFSCSLVFSPNKNAQDQQLTEKLFNSVSGFLVWLCGGETSQMPLSVPGFRLGDIFLMATTNELDGEWRDGHYAHGQANEINLVESRT